MNTLHSLKCFIVFEAFHDGINDVSQLQLAFLIAQFLHMQGKVIQITFQCFIILKLNRLNNLFQQCFIKITVFASFIALQIIRSKHPILMINESQ
ncbi:hypothetical protein D3C85_1444310 [compost metagenome]